MVTAKTMRRAMYFFLLVFAILAPSLHADGAAHAANAPAVVHEGHDLGQDLSDDDQTPDSQPDDAMAHHHCPNAWVPGQPPLLAGQWRCQSALFPANHRALRSRVDDPLTKPPAA